MISADARIPVFPAGATCVFDRDSIDTALDGLADAITRDLAGSDMLVLPVLQGGLILSGHLLTRLDFPLHQDYIHASRYRGEMSGSDLRWIARPHAELKGRTILLVDDIFDQGFTLESLHKWCTEQGAAEVKSAVLVTKEHKRDVADYRPDYSALTVDDRYIFGFGMDYEHAWRNANGIYAIND